MPVDNLDGGTVGVSYFGDMDLVNPVIVSPDAGGVYRCSNSNSNSNSTLHYSTAQ